MPTPLASTARRAVAALSTAGASLTLLAATPLAGAATQGSSHVVRAAVPAGRINHVLVVEFENEGFDATFGASSPATYLNGTLRKKGELVQSYYAIGHVSLDNYIAQVSGQAPNQDTSADCLSNGAVFADVTPSTPDADQTANPGQVDGQGCVYPASVKTIAAQLDAKIPPNHKTHVAAWRAYEQDMGNTPSRDGGNTDQTGGLTGADQFLKAWMPLVLGSPAYKHGDMLVVITFDEGEGANANASCCAQQPGPNSTSAGGGQVGALLLNAKYITPDSVDITGQYNHYSALRSYEDLLGLTTGGTDGEGHLGFAATKGLIPFGTDVFNRLGAGGR